MTPEFSRPHRLDAIGAGDSRVAIEANEIERNALARRFGLTAIDRLSADMVISRDAIGIVSRGHLISAVVQACSVTGHPVPASVDEHFVIRFQPEPGPQSKPAGEEVELSAEDCDTVFYTGTAIDLGEAAAETLALALNPFPRSAGAETSLRAAGVLSEEDTGPFAVLAKLKRAE